MNTALVCPQYWESQMECSCFHGCFKCSDITENYDIEQCLEVCKVGPPPLNNNTTITIEHVHFKFGIFFTIGF